MLAARIVMERSAHVQGVEFRGPSIPKNVWSADERDIVLVDDIERLLQDLPEAGGLKDGRPV